MNADKVKDKNAPSRGRLWLACRRPKEVSHFEGPGGIGRAGTGRRPTLRDGRTCRINSIAPTFSLCRLAGLFHRGVAGLLLLPESVNVSYDFFYIP